MKKHDHGQISLSAYLNSSSVKIEKNNLKKSKNLKEKKPRKLHDILLSNDYSISINDQFLQ